MASFGKKKGKAAHPESLEGVQRKAGRRRQHLTEAQKANRSRILRILASIVMLIVVFVLGFLLRSNVELMVKLGVVSDVDERDVNPGMTTSGSTYDSIGARIAEVEGLLAKSSMNEYDLETATSSLVTALISTTSDKYLRYYTPDRYEAYVQESAKGNYASIGVLFGEYNGSAYAVDVFDGSVAAVAGVQEGDFIVAINGDRNANWSKNEVVSALAGEEGDTVAITWRRPTSLQASGGDEFSTTLLCKEYKETNVTAQVTDQIGIITVKQLTANAAELVSDAIDRCEDQGALAYVLDIRSNPGGYLSQAVEIADLFLDKGTVCQIVTKDGTSNKTATTTVLCSKPITVLVNESTAAAAEVLASALKDNERARVVGVQTMGKGSVQVVRELSFGGALRYTAAYYLTPQGHDIDGKGITPNVSVPNVESQLRIAIETALSQL